jgi:hypothetical protein
LIREDDVFEVNIEGLLFRGTSSVDMKHLKHLKQPFGTLSRGSFGSGVLPVLCCVLKVF